jgi:NAD(P)-dependent dehydrogenase (short-subunit alcohol dehydrogenase family)
MKTIKQMLSLQNRVAVITGGCGHIGRAIADGLAEQGCNLLLIDCAEDALNVASKAIAERWGVQVEGLVVDLENAEARVSVAPYIRTRFGRVDVLVNNAGFVGDSQMTGWVVPFEEQSIETWRRAIEVNVTASFHLSQILAPMLKEHRCGSIVNVASIYGFLGPDMSLYDGTEMGNPAAYAVSKGGLIQLTRWMSTVLAPDIRVNCVSPGGVARNQPNVFVDKYIARTPLKRMGEEDDFKGAVLYLSSDMSAWVTGQNLVVDGGWSAW